MRTIIFKHWIAAIISSMMVTWMPAPSVSFAGSKYQSTLAEYIQMALACNPSIKAGQAQIEAARYSMLRARTDLLPELTTFYEYTYESERDYLWPDFPVSTEKNYEWRIKIEQPVFTGFSLSNSIRLADVELEVRKLELEINKLDLALRVKKAFFNILKADQDLQVAAQSVKSIKAHLAVANGFFRAGKISGRDLLEAEVRYENAREQWIHFQHETDMARAFFNMLLSRPLETRFESRNILVYEPLPGPRDDYLSRALNTDLGLKLIDLNLKKSALEEKIARSSYYPKVSMQYDFFKEGDDPGVSGSDFHKKDYWELTALLSWRFWQWGKTWYDVREKQCLKKKLLQMRAMRTDQIRLKIKESLMAVERAEKKMAAALKAIELAEENLCIKEKLYQMEMATSPAVLNAQTLLAEARNRLHKVIYDHHLATAELVRVLGSY